MSFTTVEFLLVFLPITFVIVYLSGKISRSLTILSVVFLSLYFYIKCDPEHLHVLLISIFLNYSTTYLFYKINRPILLKITLGIGIVMNVMILAYYKYFGAIHLVSIPLPLAISFYTFQQIDFLVDNYEKKRHLNFRPEPFLNYAGFVSFFPHLVAGPLVRYDYLKKQFNDSSAFGWGPHVISGLCLLALGLFKKIIIADHFSPMVNDGYQMVQSQSTLGYQNAIVIFLAYPLQIYFDFSGYSDMAIGLAKIFNIEFPVNFFSPYKATSLIDFWRRWHISLSTFLRDRLYIPLGGNRNGKRTFNLMLTMIVGGMWHGANYTFMLWGFLHGLGLIINHLFAKKIKISKTTFNTILFTSITFLFTSTLWVLFRSQSVTDAIFLISQLGAESSKPFFESRDLAFLFLLYAIIFFLPSSAEIFGLNKNEIKIKTWKWLQFNFQNHWIVIYGLLFLLSVTFIDRSKGFIYWKF